MNNKNNFSFLLQPELCIQSRMVFYVASKTRHAELWRGYRARGVAINSTWIDEASPGATSDRRDLAMRCIEEAKLADGLILYVEPGDSLKGALLECGAALAAGRPIFCVGANSLSRVFNEHPLWHAVSSLDEAFTMASSVPRSAGSA